MCSETWYPCPFTPTMGVSVHTYVFPYTIWGFGMGRPPLGDEARSHPVTVRLNAHERVTLVGQFGSARKGLRALVDGFMAGHQARNPLIADDAFIPVQDLEVVQDMAAAVALDRVKQALPIGEHPPEEDLTTYRNVGGDLIDPEGVLPIKTARGDAYLAEAPLPGTIAAGVDSPDTAVVAAHRHRRGVLLSTEFDKGTKVKVFACAVVGCPVELR